MSKRVRRTGRWTGAVLSMALLAVVPAAWADASAPTAGGTAAGYQLPSAALQAVVDQPRAPTLFLSPRRDVAAMLQMPSLPSIEVVAQPELKLAGRRINPRSFSDSRFSYGSKLWLLGIEDGRERQISGLPAQLSVASLAWSPDQKWLAFNQVDAATGANELWLVDVAAATARRLRGELNTALSDGYQWLPDSRGLLVMSRMAGAGAPPSGNVTPTGPAVQQTTEGSGVVSIRTYQDLLRNEADARVFDYYATAQPMEISLDGQSRAVGVAGVYLGLELSPDGRFLLSQRVQRPYSYVVPVSSFPRRIEVLDRAGTLVHTVAVRPLVEGLPTGNDAEVTGVRDIGWRADVPATLVWAEAQDGGDPNRDAAIRDAVFMQVAPFDRPPVTLARLGSRFAGITWGRGDLALLNESWWKNRRTKTWLIAPDESSTEPKLLFDRDAQDRYSDPGKPGVLRGDSGRALLQTSIDGGSIYFYGAGASPEGDRPFVDRYELASGKATRLFHSQAPTYSQPIALLGDDASSLLLTRESPEEPANYFVQPVAAGDDAAPRALTRFAHPLPQLRGVVKEQIRYKRKDGVDLTATLLLPPGYDPKRDGPRPLLMWAYPGEYKSAAAASQVTDSPYRFNAISYWGPQAFLARGYVVLASPTMPIIGEGDKEPNDTYLEQLVANAQAAVDEVVRRGVTDRDHIAIGGHSYGAFMTANLLAHSRLFKAGIARSGAYNRTLTPFGFQAEERNYWQAQDTYLKMSPFNYAGDIKDPILFIHGVDDNNSGTFPMQSERMFAAVKGLGGTARLVMLPNESHAYRARESIMTMLAESERWLEQTIGAPAEGRAAPRR